MHESLNPENLVLSVDTSTPTQALSIVRGKDILCHFAAKAPNKEGPSLLSMIDFALKYCSLKIQDFDRFVVSRGPGSFTSLRVSMALLKSFALSLNKPLYTASSLESLARSLPPVSCLICSCIDARRSEVYLAFYRQNNGICTAISEEILLKPSELIELIKNHFESEKILFIGSGAQTYQKLISDALGENALWPNQAVLPCASSMALQILEEFPHQLPPIALEALEPKYLRVESFALAKNLFESLK